MPIERVVLTVAGRPLPHERCQLQASAEKAVRAASFTVPWNLPGIPCLPDDEATIVVSGELWGTGFVGSVSSQIGPEDRVYEIAFVSRTIDAVECSIDHPTGFARDVDLKGIATEFDVLKIGIETDVSTDRKPFHKVRPGETLFGTLETDCRARGVLIYDTPKGKLKLADKPEGRHAGGLVYGSNIVEASGQLSGATRHSPIKVRGQSSVGVTATSLHPEAEVTDSGVRRRRPLIVWFEGEATSSGLKKRAAWEARRGAGRGTTASVTTAGWRDAGGRLWTRNFLVPVHADPLGIEQDMLISEASLSQDASGGTTATLSLVDPRALGGENPRGKSSPAWAAPAANDAAFRAE